MTLQNWLDQLILPAPLPPLGLCRDCAWTMWRTTTLTAIASSVLLFGMAIEVVVFSLAHHNKTNGYWGVFFVYGSVLGASVIFGVAMGRRFWWQAGLGAAMAAYIWLTVNVQILTTLFLGLSRNFLYFVNGYEFYMHLLVPGSFFLAVISALISPVRRARET